jgi:hypothetical protein
MSIKLNNITKIHFIDQTSEKNHHMVFNASMIAVLSKLVPNATIVQYGILSNLDATSELSLEQIKNKIFQVPINNPKIKSKFIGFKVLNYLRKEIIRINMFLNLFQKTSENDLVVLSITTFTSFLGFKILKLFYKTPVLCILHGDVDYLYNSTTWIEKLNGRIHKIIFKISAPNFYYILLNKIAKEKVVRDGYLKKDEVFEINHPYVNFPEGSTNNFQNDNQQVSIGHIGSMEVDRKNSHYFYQIAKSLKNLILEKKINFETVGLITPGILNYKNEWVNEIVGNSKPDKPDYLTRKEYEFQLSQLDYAIFFFDENQYIFRASGAVIDAIAFGIPIIVLKHPFFDNLIEQSGPIGYCCNDLSEMEMVLQRISHKNDKVIDEYSMFLNNLGQLKQKYSVENIASDLNNQMDKEILVNFNK